MEDSVTPSPDPAVPHLRRKHSLHRRTFSVVGVVLVAYLLVAYLLLPGLWGRYARRHPLLEDVPGITRTREGTDGDPLNVALTGTKAEVMRIMVAAHWFPADPLTLRSCLEIAEATVLKRPYDDAPVSNLYLFGRKEDLAFEQPVGADPRQRHHVRLWLSEKIDANGRPMWMGAAIFDRRVGINRMDGQITHVTAANIDAERDFLFRDLKATSDLSETYIIDEFHKLLKGKNGGGDPWFTDGRLFVGIIAPKKNSP